MAEQPLDRPTLRSLDQTRARYAQLTYALGSFSQALAVNESLIPWSNQHMQYTILSSNLDALAKTLSSNFPSIPQQQQQEQNQLNNAAYETLVAYPNTNFPAREQETLLGMLLRKKFQPEVEEWVTEGRVLGGDTTSSSVPTNGLNGTVKGGTPQEPSPQPFLNDEEVGTLWTWAGETLRQMAEEREAREEQGEDQGEEEDEGMADLVMDGAEGRSIRKEDKVAEAPTGPVEGTLNLNQIFRFWSTGALPAGGIVGGQPVR